MNNILYICIKLDYQSKLKLIETLDEYFDGQYDKTYCDHLTLAFGKECNDFDTSLLGMKVELNSNTIAFDDRCAALPIDLNQVIEFGVHNKAPHITLATTKDTKPVYSNELLRNGPEYLTLDEPMTLKGEIKAITR